MGRKVKTDHTKTNKQTIIMAEDKIFADGFSFKRSENAPDFVVGRLSMKVDEATAFMKEHVKNGWVNLNIKTARSGNHYVELDTYEPKKGEEPIKGAKKSTKSTEDLPF